MDGGFGEAPTASPSGRNLELRLSQKETSSPDDSESPSSVRLRVAPQKRLFSPPTPGSADNADTSYDEVEEPWSPDGDMEEEVSWNVSPEELPGVDSLLQSSVKDFISEGSDVPLFHTSDSGLPQIATSAPEMKVMNRPPTLSPMFRKWITVSQVVVPSEPERECAGAVASESSSSSIGSASTSRGSTDSRCRRARSGTPMAPMASPRITSPMVYLSRKWHSRMALSTWKHWAGKVVRRKERRAFFERMGSWRSTQHKTNVFALWLNCVFESRRKRKHVNRNIRKHRFSIVLSGYRRWIENSARVREKREMWGVIIIRSMRWRLADSFQKIRMSSITSKRLSNCVLAIQRRRMGLMYGGWFLIVERRKVRRADHRLHLLGIRNSILRWKHRRVLTASIATWNGYVVEKKVKQASLQRWRLSRRRRLLLRTTSVWRAHCVLMLRVKRALASLKLDRHMSNAVIALAQGGIGDSSILIPVYTRRRHNLQKSQAMRLWRFYNANRVLARRKCLKFYANQALLRTFRHFVDTIYHRKRSQAVIDRMSNMRLRGTLCRWKEVIVRFIELKVVKGVLERKEAVFSRRVSARKVNVAFNVWARHCSSCVTVRYHASMERVLKLRWSVRSWKSVVRQRELDDKIVERAKAIIFVGMQRQALSIWNEVSISKVFERNQEQVSQSYWERNALNTAVLTFVTYLNKRVVFRKFADKARRTLLRRSINWWNRCARLRRKLTSLRARCDSEVCSAFFRKWSSSGKRQPWAQLANSFSTKKLHWYQLRSVHDRLDKMVKSRRTRYAFALWSDFLGSVRSRTLQCKKASRVAARNLLAQAFMRWVEVREDFVQRAMVTRSAILFAKRLEAKRKLNFLHSWQIYVLFLFDRKSERMARTAQLGRKRVMTAFKKWQHCSILGSMWRKAYSHTWSTCNLYRLADSWTRWNTNQLLLSPAQALKFNRFKLRNAFITWKNVQSERIWSRFLYSHAVSRLRATRALAAINRWKGNMPSNALRDGFYKRRKYHILHHCTLLWTRRVSSHRNLRSSSRILLKVRMRHYVHYWKALQTQSCDRRLKLQRAHISGQIRHAVALWKVWSLERNYLRHQHDSLFWTIVRGKLSMGFRHWQQLSVISASMRFMQHEATRMQAHLGTRRVFATWRKSVCLKALQNSMEHIVRTRQSKALMRNVVHVWKESSRQRSYLKHRLMAVGHTSNRCKLHMSIRQWAQVCTMRREHCLIMCHLRVRHVHSVILRSMRHWKEYTIQKVHNESLLRHTEARRWVRSAISAINTWREWVLSRYQWRTSLLFLGTNSQRWQLLHGVRCWQSHVNKLIISRMRLHIMTTKKNRLRLRQSINRWSDACISSLITRRILVNGRATATSGRLLHALVYWRESSSALHEKRTLVRKVVEARKFIALLHGLRWWKVLTRRYKKNRATARRFHRFNSRKMCARSLGIWKSRTAQGVDMRLRTVVAKHCIDRHSLLLAWKCLLRQAASSRASASAMKILGRHRLRHCFRHWKVCFDYFVKYSRVDRSIARILSHHDKKAYWNLWLNYAWLREDCRSLRRKCLYFSGFRAWKASCSISRARKHFMNISMSAIARKWSIRAYRRRVVRNIMERHDKKQQFRKKQQAMSVMQGFVDAVLHSRLAFAKLRRKQSYLAMAVTIRMWKRWTALQRRCHSFVEVRQHQAMKISLKFWSSMVHISRFATVICPSHRLSECLKAWRYRCEHSAKIRVLAFRRIGHFIRIWRNTVNYNKEVKSLVEQVQLRRKMGFMVAALQFWSAEASQCKWRKRQVVKILIKRRLWTLKPSFYRWSCVAAAGKYASRLVMIVERRRASARLSAWKQVTSCRQRVRCRVERWTQKLKERMLFDGFDLWKAHYLDRIFKFVNAKHRSERKMTRSAIRTWREAVMTRSAARRAMRSIQSRSSRLIFDQHAHRFFFVLSLGVRQRKLMTSMLSHCVMKFKSCAFATLLAYARANRARRQVLERAKLMRLRHCFKDFTRQHNACVLSKYVRRSLTRSRDMSVLILRAHANRYALRQSWRFWKTKIHRIAAIGTFGRKVQMNCQEESFRTWYSYSRVNQRHTLIRNLTVRSVLKSGLTRWRIFMATTRTRGDHFARAKVKLIQYSLATAMRKWRAMVQSEIFSRKLKSSYLLCNRLKKKMSVRDALHTWKLRRSFTSHKTQLLRLFSFRIQGRNLRCGMEAFRRSVLRCRTSRRVQQATLRSYLRVWVSRMKSKDTTYTMIYNVGTRRTLSLLVYVRFQSLSRAWLLWRQRAERKAVVRAFTSWRNHSMARACWAKWAAWRVLQKSFNSIFHSITSRLLLASFDNWVLSTNIAATRRMKETRLMKRSKIWKLQYSLSQWKMPVYKKSALDSTLGRIHSRRQQRISFSRWIRAHAAAQYRKTTFSEWRLRSDAQRTRNCLLTWSVKLHSRRVRSYQHIQAACLANTYAMARVWNSMKSTWSACATVASLQQRFSMRQALRRWKWAASRIRSTRLFTELQYQERNKARLRSTIRLWNAHVLNMCSLRACVKASISKIEAYQKKDALLLWKSRVEAALDAKCADQVAATQGYDSLLKDGMRRWTIFVFDSVSHRERVALAKLSATARVWSEWKRNALLHAESRDLMEGAGMSLLYYRQQLCFNKWRAWLYSAQTIRYGMISLQARRRGRCVSRLFCKWYSVTGHATLRKKSVIRSIYWRLYHSLFSWKAKLAQRKSFASMSAQIVSRYRYQCFRKSLNHWFNMTCWSRDRLISLELYLSKKSMKSQQHVYLLRWAEFINLRITHKLGWAKLTRRNRLYRASSAFFEWNATIDALKSARIKATEEHQRKIRILHHLRLRNGMKAWKDYQCRVFTVRSMDSRVNTFARHNTLFRSLQFLHGFCVRRQELRRACSVISIMQMKTNFYRWKCNGAAKAAARMCRNRVCANELLSYGMLKWKDYHLARANVLDIISRATLQLSNYMLLSVVYSWRMQARTINTLRVRNVTLSKARATRAKMVSLDTWKSFIVRASRALRIQRALFSHRRDHCFSLWKAFVTSSHQIRLQEDYLHRQVKNRAVSRRLHILSDATECWRVFVFERQRRTHSLKSFLSAVEKRSVRIAFDELLSHCAFELTMKRTILRLKREQSLENMTAARDLRFKCSAIHYWRLVTTSRLRSHRQSRIIMYRHEVMCQKVAMQKWWAFVTMTQLFNRLTERIVTIRKLTAVVRWRSQVAFSTQVSRIRCRRMASLRSGAFAVLRALTEHAKFHRQVLLACTNMAYKRSLRRVFSKWARQSDIASREKQLSKAANQGLHRCYGRAVATWKHFATMEGTSHRMKLHMLGQKWSHRTLTSAWSSWRDFARASRKMSFRVNYIRINSKNIISRQCMLKWRSWASRSRKNGFRVRYIQMMRKAARLSEGWAQFKRQLLLRKGSAPKSRLVSHINVQRALSTWKRPTSGSKTNTRTQENTMSDRPKSSVPEVPTAPIPQGVLVTTKSDSVAFRPLAQVRKTDLRSALVQQVDKENVNPNPVTMSGSNNYPIRGQGTKAISVLTMPRRGDVPHSQLSRNVTLDPAIAPSLSSRAAYSQKFGLTTVSPSDRTHSGQLRRLLNDCRMLPNTPNQ